MKILLEYLTKNITFDYLKYKIIVKKNMKQDNINKVRNNIMEMYNN